MMIKRKWPIALIISISICVFAACGARTVSPYSPRQISEVIIAAQGEMPDLYPLYPDDEHYSPYLSDIYLLGQNTPGDGVLYYAGGIEASEIAVFKFGSAADAEAAEALLIDYKERRAAAFTGYAPEQAALVEKSVVARRGAYAALLICANPTSAESSFNACFSANPPSLPGAAELSRIINAAGQADSGAEVADTAPAASDAAQSAAGGASEAQTTHQSTSAIAAAEKMTSEQTTTRKTEPKQTTSESTTAQTPVASATEQATTERTTTVSSTVTEPTTAAPAVTEQTTESQTATEQTTAEPSSSEQVIVSQPETEQTTEQVTETSQETASEAPAPSTEPTSRMLTPADDEYDLAADIYDSASILAAWRSGDWSGMTYKNLTILVSCANVINEVIIYGMSEYDMELAIHDWIIKWADYDREAISNAPNAKPDPDNDNPYGLLVNKNAICMGYTSTFKLFMDMVGIECIIVEGSARQGVEPHAWNMVRLDGEWYCVDVTWNDPIGSGNTNTYVFHKYFNVTSQFLRDNDHQWDESTAPEATADKYVWKPVA